MPELIDIAGEEVFNIETGRRGTHETEEILDLLHNTHPTERPVIVYDKEFLHTDGVLSDRQIKVGLEIGHVVCDPYPRVINGSSVDVTLGYYFYHAGSPDQNGGIFNPFDRDDTHRYFGIKDPENDFMEAKPWGEVRSKIKKQMGEFALSKYDDLNYLPGIPEEHPMILLRPGERILAHTNEFIGILPPGTTSMQARSTMGRIGLSACYCAGWGDPGYINRWTMEIHNLNENEYLPLPVGFRPAQIVFSATGPVGTEYSKASGNYQKTSANDLATIKKTWRPYGMIPQAFKNELLLPTQVEGLSEGLK